MSMTENEAKEWLAYLGNKDMAYDRAKNKRKLACDVAIIALEEIQAYRAIGTVAEFKALKEKSVAKPRLLQEGRYYCPTCGRIADMGYCKACGQNLY